MYGDPAHVPRHPGRPAPSLTLPRLRRREQWRRRSLTLPRKRGREGWGLYATKDHLATRSWAFGLGHTDDTFVIALGVDRHRDGKTGAEQAGEWTGGRERNPHRDALHDLGEIAGRVVRWQQAELGAAGRGETLDPALQDLIRIGVDRHLGELPR